MKNKIKKNITMLCEVDLMGSVAAGKERALQHTDADTDKATATNTATDAVNGMRA